MQATAPPAPERDRSFDDWAAAGVERAQALIERHVPQRGIGVLGDAAGAGTALATTLDEAMHYAAALGGKRMRPLLVWAAGECFGADMVALDAAACAVELIHAYSLVHDDLPCMDDDVLRRGLPTTHVRFGEAVALLAGDALQTRAFEVLTADPAVPGVVQAALCGLLARAAGGDGMAGGQAIDLAATGARLEVAALSDMHRRKTGALLKASVLMGLACSPLQGEELRICRQAATGYADAIGLAFQVVDDVLDASADSVTLGKTAGKDALQDKATFVTLLGLPAARALADDLLRQALAALADLPAAQRARAGRLAELAHRIVERTH